jgi:SAM-dependent methyltransferase
MGNLQKYRSRNPIQRWLIGRFLDCLVRLAGRVPHRSILDAGCGEGFGGAALRAGLGARVDLYSLDLDSVALGYCLESDPTCAAVRGDLRHLPYADGSFDLVVATEVLEHLEEPEPALVELLRVSRGHAILSVPAEPLFRAANLARLKNVSRLGSDPDHRQHWTRAGFLRLVSRRGRLVAAPRGVFPWTLALVKVRG